MMPICSQPPCPWRSTAVGLFVAAAQVVLLNVMSLVLLSACAFEQIGAGAATDAVSDPDPDVGMQVAALAWPNGNVDSVNRHTVEGWACIADYKHRMSIISRD